MTSSLVILPDSYYIENFKRVTTGQLSFRGYPVKGGLFDPKIFGSLEPCCGATIKGYCERCKIEVLDELEYKDKFGYILSPVPVIFGIAEEYLKKLFGIKVKNITDIEVYIKTGTKYPTKDGRMIDVIFSTPKKFWNWEYLGLSSVGINNFLQYVDWDNVDKKLVKDLIKAGTRPEYLTRFTIPVLSPAFRPMINNIVHPLNILYQRIIYYTNRLNSLLSYNNIDNEVIRFEIENIHNVLKDLTEGCVYSGTVMPGLFSYLVGKNGLVRKNILGKKVDFSGRSVISVNPEEIFRVGIPFEIAIKLYEPELIRDLINTYGVTKYIAKRAVREANSVLKPFIEKYQGDYLLLLRNPSLHKLSVQAYKWYLHFDKTIKLPPVATTGHNADFDGDTMAVFRLHSKEANRELEDFVALEKNPKLPIDGSPIHVFTQEFLYGLYYLTETKNEIPKLFNPKQLELAVSLKEISHNTKVKLKINGKITEMTYGQYKVYEATEFKIENIKFPIDKKSIKRLLSKIIDFNDSDYYERVLTKLKDLGREYATGTLTVGIDDFKIEFDKSSDGHEFIELSNKVLEEFFKNEENNLVRMVKTGARGNKTQISQMVIAKGTIVDHKGTIKTIIKSSLIDGLNTIEYLLSTHGSRKGLMDRGLTIAKPGYLERRLVNAVRNYAVIDEDCGNTEYIRLPIEASLGLYSKNYGLITKDILEEHKGELVSVRQPSKCKIKGGYCQKCAGEIDLGGFGKLEIGENLGVLAATSLSEPTSQATLRTFHTSGAGSNNVDSVIANNDGKVKLVNCKFGQVISSKNIEVPYILVENKIYPIPNGYKIIVENNSIVKSGDKLAIQVASNDVTTLFPQIEGLYKLKSEEKTDPAIIAEEDGTIKIIENIIEVKVDGNKIHLPMLAIKLNNKIYNISRNQKLLVTDGDYVKAGKRLTIGPIKWLNYIKYEFFDELWLNEALNLYKQIGVTPNVKYLGAILKVLKDYGFSGITRIGYNKEDWFERLSFGYIRKALDLTLISPESNAFRIAKGKLIKAGRAINKEYKTWMMYQSK